MNIGIVGAGVAGLHLGHHLLKHGIPVTLYTDKTGEQVQGGRLLNTVALFPATRDRDTALGVNHWQLDDFGMFSVYVHVGGDQPFGFRGDLSRPAIFIDMRLYLPTLLRDLEARGGKVVLGAFDPAAVRRAAADHDVIVVATGRDGLGAMFPRIPERSPITEPQRRLFAGLFRGIRFPDPLGMPFQISPGHGEIFENQILTADGRTSGILIEAIPGGALEVATRARREDDPRRFDAMVLDLLRAHAPVTYERIDASAFELRRPLDMLQGAVTPVVRRAWAPLDGGRFALAAGENYITHDPLTGQGANAAARTAWLLGEAIVAHVQRGGGAFDEAFCADVDARLWASEEPVTQWSLAALSPPPPHLIALLVAATQNKAIGDAFVDNFNDPPRQWEAIKSPEGAAALAARFGASLPAL